jgi:Ca2+-binding RTX toxin-like protein
MLFGLFLLVLISVVTAIAATNTVPPTRLGNQTKSITSNDVKPASCASLDLRNIVSGSGVITGTAGNDLILGSPGNDIINGMGGDDCIIGGSGNDIIDGGDGNDICNGGGSPGDIFRNCEVVIP